MSGDAPDRDLQQRLAGLSPARRRLLLQRLKLEAGALAAAEGRPPLVARPRGAAAPLSWAQERLWFLSRLDPASPLWNLAGGVRLVGELHVAALAASLREVVRRHEALRTTFALAGDGVVQRVAAAGELAPEMAVVDLAGLPEERREGALGAACAQAAGRGFDLETGPLVRGLLLRARAGEHALLVNLHHVVADGWSVAVLLRETAVAYEAFAAGRRPALPPLPVQYADFAVWQREWLSGEALAEQLGYWRQRLAGAPPVLDLPADRPRPAVRRARGAVRRCGVPAAGVAGLRRLLAEGGEGGLTLFMGLLAVFSGFLARLTGERDLVVGTTIANRTRPELEGLIGYFVNSLPLRVEAGGAASLRVLLGRAREAAVGAFSHQDLPFQKLVEELKPPRDASRTPLFQVALQVHNEPRAALRLPGLEVAPLELGADTAKFDLLLSLREEAVVAGVWEYDADLFDGATVARLDGYFTALLEGAVAEPDRPVGELAILSPAERQALLVEWGGGGALSDPAHPLQAPDDTLSARFRRRAAAAPAAEAVVFENERVTYGELAARSERLARRLAGLGVRPGDRVGLFLERSVGLVEAVLAVLDAGAAYVPLDPAYPAERVRFVLEDAGVSLVLASAETAGKLPGEGVQAFRVVLLGEDGEGFAQDRASAPLGTVAEKRLGGEGAGSLPAYVIYTSGSTGRPKGVVVSHAQVLRLFEATEGWFGFGASDVWTLFHSYAFDFSVWELWGALLYGGRLEVVPYWVSRSPEAFLRLLRERGVTVLNQTPSAFKPLLAGLAASGGDGVRLRAVVFGGEGLEPASLAAWWDLPAARGARLINMYGITETTVHVTYRPLRRTDTASVIGVPIPDLRVVVAGPDGAPVPIGVAGELLVGGAGVTQGYLGRPELTAARFVPDPFGEAGGRLYRSGDLGRWMRGDLEHLGRIDQQVKVRGFRIELGEIEAALAAHPAVRAAAVVLREEAGERSLAAAVVGTATGAELRSWAAARLPEYMVPAAFAAVEALPMTPSGKLDRRALAALVQMVPGAPERGYVAPSTAMEELVAAAFCQVLRREGIGAEGSFFELGGDSIRAAVLANRLQETLGAEVPLVEVFQAPTVADLAARLAELHRSGPVAPLLEPVLRQQERASAGADPAAPLSWAQERLWFLEQLEPGLAAYNIPAVLRLAGRLEPAVLAAVFAEIVRRHSVLRSRFEERPAGPVQVVAPAGPVPLPLVDLGEVDGARAELPRLAAAEAARPFDLARGPVLRLVLVRLGGAEHVLLLTLHHVAGDGWSFGVLLREAAALYGAFARGGASPLPPLPVQYADYARWQRRTLDEAALAPRVAEWRQWLAGVEDLELPADRPRPPVPAPAARHHRVRLDGAVAAVLGRIGRQQGATLFLTLLAAVQALLGRLSGQGRFAVGAPSANRPRAELESLIGLFVNMLPIPADLAGDPSFGGLVARVREAAVAAFAGQEVPFERLVQELRPRREAGRNPLFQATFQLYPAEAEAAPAGELAISRVEAAAGATRFDLELSAAEPGADGTLGLGLISSAALFDGATARRLLRHFETLLAAVAADPARPVSEIPLLGPAEVFQLAVEWNDSAAPYPTDCGVHQLFAAQAVARPREVAASWGAGEAGGQVSYGELALRAGRIAAALARAGVRPGDVVALAAGRGAERVGELAAGLVGILAAGAAYLPLDPEEPAERLRFQLADAGAAALVAGPAEAVRLDGLVGEIPPAGIPIVPVDPAGAPMPFVATGGGDLAYVMYTSGSTGRPKGVAVPHRAIARLVLGTAYCPLGPADRIPQLAHPAFDALTFEVWGALLHGARLVGVAREVALAPRALARELAAQGITAMFVTTALFQQVALEAPDAFRGVRTLMMGGELLRPERARAVLAAGGPARLLHVYGPTESTTFAAWERVRAVAEGAGSVPIGRPLDRTRLHVLDRRLRPVPVGVAGELCVAGDGLALGYWRRPELTAERFVPDPLGGPGERLYRTGDRVRWLADGRIDFLGRFDHQVKVRGFRIEPGEVEAALALHPAVREALVQAVEDPRSGDRRLAAWVVPREGAAAGDAELAAFLRERLPAAMVPSAWVRLAAWPLTPSGKIDRRALPAPERAAAGGGAPLRGALEAAVGALCADLLGLTAVGAEDDFFELGGHSLLATQLVSRVRAELGVELPLRAVFETPTVRGLAAAVGEVRAAAAGTAAAPPLAPQPREGDLPLSFAQERLWFLDRLAPGNPFYNMPAVVRMIGDLAVPALAGALAAVSARHEAVRTRFPERGGRPVQEVGAPGWPLPVVDLAALPAAAAQSEGDRLAGEDARLPFDLARGPVVRARLVRVSAGEHLLLLNLHHIVADGWSFGVLVGEVAVLVPALAAGRPAALPPLPVQVPDFAVWQRGWLTGEVWERQMAYWRARLAGMPASLGLPTDRPRPALQRFRGDRVRAALPVALREGLAGLAREAGGTLFMPLLAAFGAVVSRYAGQVDVAVGSPIANRNRAEIEGLIGFFVNALVLRLDLAGAPGFRELVARAREVALGAYAHQDLPFEKLVEELQPQRDMSRNPLFQVVLALQNAPLPPVELPGVRLEPLRLQDETAKFDLKLDLWEGLAGLTGAWQFDTDLFDAPTIARFGEHFRALVGAALAEPDRPVEELAILTPAERQALVVEWGGGALVAAAHPLQARDDTLTARFRRRAAAEPAAEAVAFEGERLTYGELAARVEKLARRLAGLGVRPGDRVGLFLERSVGLVEAVLGVLDAGAAYVPLDPAYPAERVRFVLEDAGVSLVLASAETAGKLPGEGGQAVRVVLLGEDGEGAAQDRASAPLGTVAEKRPGGEGAGSLPAYVIYTSGSTGRPKGVVVSHAQVLRLFEATEGWFGFGASDVWTLFHSYAFDFSVWELWGALLYGGRLEVVPYWVSRSPEAFLRLLRERGVTVLNQTPSAFKPLLAALAASGGDGLSLRAVVFGGEGLEPASLAAWWELPAARGARLINMYGITETTVHVTYRLLRRTDTASVIGVPIPDLRVVVAGPGMALAPMGVPGELLVGGAGVTQGYLGRPELTATRFVPDPFGEAGGRLYRSGDLGRWTARGDLEHLGRIDQQVKVRGFRIELGEIEAALTAHPAVQAAAVVLREDVPGERALAAYVVAAAEEEGEGGQAAQVESWRQVFDDTYGTGAGALAETFDITGWTSAATGEAIPAAEMAEWLEDTVAGIRALAPRRVLEIGCGTGLVLFRVAPGCAAYLGTDISARALGDLRRKLARPELAIPGVRLEQRAADDFAGIAPGAFDVVVINSVAQYLPSAEYFERVLAGAVAAVAPGGAVFVGDVRSLPLLRAFHAGVQLERAEGELGAAQLEARIRQQGVQETELVLAPAFFAAVARRLPRVSAVEVSPKSGRAENELTRFRYQVVLRVEGPAGAAASALDWQSEGLELGAVRRLLAEARPAALLLRGIPNARLAREAALLRLLAAAAPATPAAMVRERLAAALEGAPGVHPDELAELAAGAGYRVRLGWAEPGEDGRFDALLVRGDVDPAGFALPGPAAAELPPAAFASRPREGLFARRVAPELRRHLRERLPDYMVPAALVLLDRLPLTPEGKLDRRALPAPDRGQAAGTAYRAPRTPLEETLAAAWAGVLGLERVGVEDDFFQLGGHSLLATQVVSRLREALGVEVPLRRLFEAPTVAALARALERERGLPAGVPPLVRAPRDRPLPLSFAQERIWFLDRLAPGGDAYNEPLAVALAGPLQAGALARAFGEVARRHEALRTAFPEVDGRPVQVIGPAVEPVLPVADLSALPAAVRSAEAGRLQMAQVRRGFDLARGPLLRALLVRLGPAEHRLVAVLHHIVFDGWSTGVLARELSALYGAYAAGRPSPLPALPLQVADFARWQRGWLQGEVLAGELAWWRARLAGAADLELPADRPRSGAPAEKGTVGLRLPAELAGRLREVGRQRGATLFMVLLAAFQALLGRLAGQPDVVVGSPVANRDRAELEGVLGFFVNMLVLRADLAGDPAFEAALARVREAALGAYEHQHLPFERLVDELQPRREAGRNPLFQVVFQLLNTPPPALALPGVAVRPLAAAAGAAKFDLDLSLVETGGAGPVAGTLDFHRGLFDGATARRLAAAFVRLLEAAAADPAAPLSRLPLLGAAERHQLVAEWNDRPGRRLPAVPLYQLFAAQAAARPEARAVTVAGVPAAALTYGGLARWAALLDGRLRAAGVAPGMPVGIALERSPALIAAILGILRAGGAYVPLDPVSPRERVAAMAADAGVRLVVVDEAGAARVREWGLVPALLPERPAETAAGAAAPAVEVPADSLAYVLFTSGSTGRPKGVGVPHRAVHRLVAGADWADFGPELVFLQAAPASFDASTLEIWAPLAHGGRLAVLPAARPSLAELGAAVAGEGVNALWLTAGLFRQVAEGDLAPYAGVRQLFAGGDVLPPAQVERVVRELPGCRLVNGYGPTENTTFTCCHPVAGGRLRPSVPIGRPIAGSWTRVLGLFADGFAPLPVGAAGELCAGGNGLALGYVGRPDLTAERFVPDPAGEPGAGSRLYRTGDRVRLLADGTAEFLGRLDAQVKVRGFRVEPAEVEAALGRHPAVAGAAVGVREDGLGEKRLVAWVTARAGLPPAAELRAFLAGLLPEPMIPSAFVEVPALPLAATGKVDRAALPDPAPAAAAVPAACRTPLEEIVAGVWQEVLGVPAVGPEDDFFDLGGHSLLATRVVARLRPVLGVELPLADLFAAPTVAALARRAGELLAAAAGAGVPPLVPLPAAARGGDLPLSFAQERLWFLDRLVPDNPFYNVPCALRLRGPLAMPALAAALDGVVARHEALRTAFAEVAGRPVQRIAPAARCPLPVVDLAGLPPAAAGPAALALATAEALRPFDLGRAPLLRGLLLRLPERGGERAHALVLTAHHVASDGWSTAVLIREVAALYGAALAGRPSPLPPLPVQYADVAVWQRGWLTGEALAAQLAWWRGELGGGLPALELPVDRPRPAFPAFRGGTVEVAFASALSRGVRRLAREAGATPFMVLLAAWAALLQRFTGQADFAVGTPVANRTRAEMEGLIGFFVNTLALRVRPAPALPFRALVERVRETALGAYAHQDLPFERLVEELRPERDPSRTPLFQVMFALQNVPLPALAPAGGLSLAPWELERRVALFDLTLDLAERGEGFAGLLEHDADLFERASMRRLGEQLRTLLAGAVADPERALGGLPLLSAAERHQVRAEWNDTARGPGRALPGTLAALLRARAAAAPEAPAAVFEGEELTYGELVRRGAALADRLRDLGVGPEVRVGILLERSLDLPVAIAGALLAGGAYVPLDPDYPAERASWILADSAAAVVVTRARLLERLAGAPTAARAVLLDEGWPAGTAPAPAPPSPEPLPANAAYVLYTSGSTGRPKGALIPHRAVVAYCAATVERLGLGPDDRILQFVSPGFDVMVGELFPTWMAGGTVVLCRPARLAEPAGFLRVVEEERLTGFELPTAFWHDWVDALAAAGSRLPAHLRFVATGTERVSRGRLEAWWGLGCDLVHVFGLTETTVTSSLHVQPAGRRWAEAGPLPIGRPLAEVALHLLDGAGTPVGIGVRGEVYVGGVGVGRGYLGRPDLTAERFVPDGGSGASGARLYRTGDAARRRPDGALELLGRLDRQLKVRGYRIEPGEIEAALEAHPGVREAVVELRRERGLERLVGYVVASNGSPPGAGELKAWLRERLPEYMVPSAWVALQGLPLTAHGKVDRGALPAPEARAGHVAPRSPVEATLAGILAEVLGLERVGVEDDFFELGGHSLLAAQAIARVRQAFGVEVPLRRLFEAPTVAALALAVVGLQVTAGGEGELAGLLAELEGLSDEEARALLEEG